MTTFSKTERPSGLRRTIYKQIESDGRDCPIEWVVDFGRMEILLYAPFVSPTLLLDCLRHIARSDERFAQTGINSPIQISNRFTIKLAVAHGDAEVWYKMRVYKLTDGINEKQDRFEIELTGIPG